MTGFTGFATDRNLRAWQNAGAVDRAVGDGLTFVATEASARLGKLWMERHILPKYKHPQVVERVIRRHINPVIGRLPVEEVRPVHIDNVLTRIVAAGAPTVANDALRYLFRMFHFAVKRKWIESNPAYGFDLSDAGGPEASRERALDRKELETLAKAMRETPNFGRPNELAVWLLLE